MALTCPLDCEEQRGLGLLAGLPVSGHHGVLELSTLRPQQGLRIVYEQGPRGVLSGGGHPQDTTVGAGWL